MSFQKKAGYDWYCAFFFLEDSYEINFLMFFFCIWRAGISVHSPWSSRALGVRINMPSESYAPMFCYAT